MKCQIVIVSIALAIAVAGCSTGRSASQNTIIMDTVRLAVDEDGYREVKAGDPVKRTVMLRDHGDQAVFSMGEPIEICLDGIDGENETVVTIVDHDRRMVQMRVVDRVGSKIVFTKKCQTAIYSSLSELPTIEVGSGLDLEQIVITPLCTEIGIAYGYEVRYGSEERGCRKAAQTSLQRFQKCKGTFTRAAKVTAGSYFGIRNKK